MTAVNLEAAVSTWENVVLRTQSKWVDVFAAVGFFLQF